MMRVPTGTFKVSVYVPYDPGYWAPNATAKVTQDSTITVDFYLQRPIPVPEIPAGMLSIIIALTLTAVFAVRKRSPKL